MSKITAITVQEKNKKRCNIYIDGDFFIGLNAEIVYENNLKVGNEIDKDRLKEITIEKDKSDALSKAINYLSKSMKTKKQIKTYLLGKGYSEEVVYYCIDKLKEYNYINDTEYAEKYILAKSKNEGKNLIQFKLMQKGVKKEDILNAFDDVEIDSKENARQLAEKRLKNKEITDELIVKTYRYIISKGFSYEDASYAIKPFKEI